MLYVAVGLTGLWLESFPLLCNSVLRILHQEQQNNLLIYYRAPNPSFFHLFQLNDPFLETGLCRLQAVAWFSASNSLPAASFFFFFFWQVTTKPSVVYIFKNQWSHVAPKSVYSVICPLIPLSVGSVYSVLALYMTAPIQTCVHNTRGWTVLKGQPLRVCSL